MVEAIARTAYSIQTTWRFQFDSIKTVHNSCDDNIFFSLAVKVSTLL